MQSDIKPLAVVTGSVKRLGLAFATTLIKRGFAILLHYNHSKPEVKQVIKDLEAMGGIVYAAQADLSDPVQIQALFKVVDSIDHPLHVLVNSAAVMYRADVKTMTCEAWDETFAVNLRAPFLCSQEAVKRMETGLIVNISDIGARKTWTNYPSYVVSKAALESLTRIFARAVGPKVRVNGIAPGLILQPENSPEVDWESLITRIPLRRAGSTEEIIRAFVFLLENEYITGQILRVDGGYDLL